MTTCLFICAEVTEEADMGFYGFLKMENTLQELSKNYVDFLLRPTCRLPQQS